jgi:hypothetical protein
VEKEDIMGDIKIIETDGQINQMIITEIDKHIKEVLVHVKTAILGRTRHTIIEAIKSSPEYIALLKGRLRGEFGLADPGIKLDALLSQWGDEIEITTEKRTLKIQAVDIDMSLVLAMSEAFQTTEKGQELHWLSWLLREGDKTIVKEYDVRFDTGKSSRSGQAIMVEGKKKKWSVPPQYSGTKTRNWITRAIDTIDDGKFEQMIIKEVIKRW